MLKIFETEFVIVFYEESKKQLEVIWTSKTALLEDSGFIEHVKKYAEISYQYTIRTIFVDAREYLHIVTEEISKWHDGEIIPQYVKNGIKKIAFLQPAETFAQLGHQFIFDEEKAKTGLQVQFFDSEAKARLWLGE